MTTHIVPAKNWHIALIDIIEAAQNGDTIIVSAVEEQKLAERAMKRMVIEKNLIFQLAETRTSDD